MKKKMLTSLFLAATTLLWSCASLQHVNDFSSAAEKDISGYSTLPYSYEQHCRDLCTQKYEAELLNGKAAFKPSFEPQCDCASEKVKDSDAAKAYTVLLLYFNGLQKLSASGSFVYKTTDLTAAMAKAKVISDPKLQAPVTSIADIVLNMATTAYREHKLREILAESKDPVDQLLADLIESNQLLQAECKNSYSQYLYLLTVKYSGSTPVSPAAQLNDFMANTAAKSQLKKDVQQLDDFNAQLQKIKDAHLKLAGERMTLRDKELITYLYTQASQLKNNISKL